MKLMGHYTEGKCIHLFRMEFQESKGFLGNWDNLHALRWKLCCWHRVLFTSKLKYPLVW